MWDTADAYRPLPCTALAVRVGVDITKGVQARGVSK